MARVASLRYRCHKNSRNGKRWPIHGYPVCGYPFFGSVKTGYIAKKGLSGRTFWGGVFLLLHLVGCL